MSEQVFEIEALKRRALQLLQDRGDYLPVGTVALSLGVPLYAADAALESAWQQGLVDFEAGAGWRIRS